MASLESWQSRKFRLHKRTRRVLEEAYRQYLPFTLVEALPSLGKSYNAIRAGLRTNERITILTGRGREEQYHQYKNWCENARLDYRILPSFPHDCPSSKGENGEVWENRMNELYESGIPTGEIHGLAEDHFGQDPPCAPECPYEMKWQFDPTQFDVLIGHYSHAHVPKVIASRTVVLDEFPAAAYEQEIENPAPLVTEFLEEGLPFVGYTDLIENRDDDARLEQSREWFNTHGLTLSSDEVLESEALTTSAPKVAYTLLFAENLGNGWARVALPGTYDFEIGDTTFELSNGHLGLENRAEGSVYLLQPPNLNSAKNVIGLDGTPTPTMWETSLGLYLEPNQVLTDSERREYLQDILNLDIIRTTDAIKPYQGSLFTVEQDAALLNGIMHREGTPPDLITSKDALEAYRNEGVLDGYVGDSAHFGNLLGSNEFEESSVGCVIGSNHFGDDFVKKWGAYAGVTAERGDGKGVDLSYGTYGDKVLAHMREAGTLQALLRFGRDGNGATIYVHTNTLPDWIPAGTGTVYEFWEDREEQEPENEGLLQVTQAGIALGEWRTSDLADHPEVDISERMVRTWLKRLHNGGYVECFQEGRGFTWRDRRLGDIEHGILVVGE